MEILASDPLPLIVAGTERWLSFFSNCSKVKRLIAGTLNGNHAQTPLTELAALAQPFVRSYRREQQLQVLQEFEGAIGSGRAVAGIAQVWRTAGEGYGATLLVEEGFHCSVRLTLDGVSFTSTANWTASSAPQDAVDKTIEMVLARQGRVVFVEEDALAADGRIGLILPYWIEWKNKLPAPSDHDSALAAVGASE